MSEIVFLRAENKELTSRCDRLMKQESAMNSDRRIIVSGPPIYIDHDAPTIDFTVDEWQTITYALKAAQLSARGWDDQEMADECRRECTAVEMKILLYRIQIGQVTA